ncbi:MAG: ATP-grasp domain-containing protein, partial [Clostridia bacterium]|nr:ATP-grasp domain-containing protein [Clostridia bacterium]
MKKGILVYTKEDAEINKWFISHITEELKSKGIELKLLIYGEKLPENIDFCINRSRFSDINKELEKKGIRCFNNGKTVEIANDKWETYKLCKALSVPVMETKEGTCFETEELPFVLKSKDGHGGSEVMLITERKIPVPDIERYIVQKVSSEKGLDVRVYV